MSSKILLVLIFRLNFNDNGSNFHTAHRVTAIAELSQGKIQFMMRELLSNVLINNDN